MTMNRSRRISNWPRALADFVDSRRNEPFLWGKHDCCLFAADAALAITGIDAAAHLRGTYDSAMSAMRIINLNTDLETLIDRCCSGVGFEHTKLKFAMRGDVVMIGDERPWAGVVMGDIVAGPGEHGVVFASIGKAVKAWRVD